MRAGWTMGLLLVACASESATGRSPGTGTEAPAPASSPTSPSPSGSISDATPPASTSTQPPAPPPESIKLDVPYVAQKPELPRGCEVTALTMALKFDGVDADKMKLAQQIDKVPYKEDGLMGDPNDGFVGDMYTFQNPGYGVYHAPVERLAEQYRPGKVVKLTGSKFDDLLANYVGQKRPVWVITNATWNALPDSDPNWHTWTTKNGTIKITMQEHSVVITGYDPTSVYINDPLDSKTNKKLDRAKFKAAWEQMGKQALAFSP